MLNLDHLIIGFDKGLRTLLSKAQTVRAYPDEDVAEVPLSETEKKHAIGLMRINHSGEICAQALYQGQALTARDPLVQKKLEQAAWEETEHLAWTSRRVEELGGHLSVLNPLWYTGSLALGAFAGLLGDKWNLGFLAETERQVGGHLQEHLQELPAHDARSRAIVQQMYTDEIGHSDMALEMGGAELPAPVKLTMQLTSKLLTSTAYWV
jgi:ubiquinone biosynthesis monooxygenase Coq7